MKLRRRYVLLYLLVLSILALFVVFQSYDKFARNPSINNINKKVILRYLDEDEQQFLVDNNLNVKVFYQYIKVKNFKLQNYQYYNLVKKYFPSLKNSDLVNKTNTLVEEEYTLNGLKYIFENKVYSINQLIALAKYSNDADGTNIEYYPNKITTLLDGTKYIGTYKPNDLVKIHNELTNYKDIYLRKETAQQLDQMCKAMQEDTTKYCGGLTIEYGYLSYEQLAKINSKNIVLKPGYSEMQLGMTIIFKTSKDFIKSNNYLWLLNNGAKYGFVARYLNTTYYKYYYNHFRYLGSSAATKFNNKINNQKLVEEEGSNNE
ncbi:MAG: D-alanyl-D-alanine carboxypeptidase family protein [Bacilli bacterium]|nr:D-alanyl-D-alanine carboxypeptidase family protein [Bacilli bacterium]